jgi:hypothetical protein
METLLSDMGYQEWQDWRGGSSGREDRVEEENEYQDAEAETSVSLVSPRQPEISHIIQEAGKYDRPR